MTLCFGYMKTRRGTVAVFQWPAACDFHSRGVLVGTVSSRSSAGEALAGLPRPHRPFAFQLPGTEMVPWKEPVVFPVTLLNKRWQVKPPVAPVNRPVPPVMLAFSTMATTPGVGVVLP